MAQDTHSNGQHGGGHHHVIPQGKLFATGFALIVLMVLTIVAAQAPYWTNNVAWQEASLLNNVVMLTIATVKAILVVQIFMGVKFGTKLTKLFAYGGFVWFFMLFIMFADYFTRSWEPVPGWEPGVESALPRDATIPSAYADEMPEKKDGDH